MLRCFGEPIIDHLRTPTGRVPPGFRWTSIPRSIIYSDTLFKLRNVAGGRLVRRGLSTLHGRFTDNWLVRQTGVARLRPPTKTGRSRLRLLTRTEFRILLCTLFTGTPKVPAVFAGDKFLEKLMLWNRSDCFEKIYYIVYWIIAAVS